MVAQLGHHLCPTNIIPAQKSSGGVARSHRTQVKSADAGWKRRQKFFPIVEVKVFRELNELNFLNGGRKVRILGEKDRPECKFDALYGTFRWLESVKN